MGLRRGLRLAEAPELINLPWEFLYHPTLHRFLALSDRTPLVRYHELPEQIQPLAIHPPLRVLVMVSSPAGYPRLDAELEWSRLKAALADQQEQGWCSNRGVRDRQSACVTAQAARRRVPCVPVHWARRLRRGHTGRCVLMEDEAGNSQVARGRHLGTLLHDHRSLRLAVLNSCAGAAHVIARSIRRRRRESVIQGVPAVIAMQFDISDKAAVAFAQEF